MDFTLDDSPQGLFSWSNPSPYSVRAIDTVYRAYHPRYQQQPPPPPPSSSGVSRPIMRVVAPPLPPSVPKKVSRSRLSDVSASAWMSKKEPQGSLVVALSTTPVFGVPFGVGGSGLPDLSFRNTALNVIDLDLDDDDPVPVVAAVVATNIDFELSEEVFASMSRSSAATTLSSDTSSSVDDATTLDEDGEPFQSNNNLSLDLFLLDPLLTPMVLQTWFAGVDLVALKGALQHPVDQPASLRTVKLLALYRSFQASFAKGSQ